MKTIPLCNREGKTIAEALVDDDDYERLREYRWSLHKHGYAVRSTSVRKSFTNAHGEVSRIRLGKMFYMQREVMRVGPSERRVVDHINETKLDNRKENLQLKPRWMNGYGNLPSKNGAHPALGHLQKKNERNILVE